MEDMLSHSQSPQLKATLTLRNAEQILREAADEAEEAEEAVLEPCNLQDPDSRAEVLSNLKPVDGECARIRNHAKNTNVPNLSAWMIDSLKMTQSLRNIGDSKASRPTLKPVEVKIGCCNPKPPNVNTMSTRKKAADLDRGPHNGLPCPVMVFKAIERLGNTAESKVFLIRESFRLADEEDDNDLDGSQGKEDTPPSADTDPDFETSPRNRRSSRITPAIKQCILKVCTLKDEWEYRMLMRLRARLSFNSRILESILMPLSLESFNDGVMMRSKHYPYLNVTEIVAGAQNGLLWGRLDPSKSRKKSTSSMARDAEITEDENADIPDEEQESALGVSELLAAFILIELMKVIESVHCAGFVHGRIASSNILIRTEGSGDKDQGWEAMSRQFQPCGKDGWSKKGILLLDFASAIDVDAFSTDQTFKPPLPLEKATECAPKSKKKHISSFEIATATTPVKARGLRERKSATSDEVADVSSRRKSSGRESNGVSRSNARSGAASIARLKEWWTESTIFEVDWIGVAKLAFFLLMGRPMEAEDVFAALLPESTKSTVSRAKKRKTAGTTELKDGDVEASQKTQGNRTQKTPGKPSSQPAQSATDEICMKDLVSPEMLGMVNESTKLLAKAHPSCKGTHLKFDIWHRLLGCLINIGHPSMKKAAQGMINNPEFPWLQELVNDAASESGSSIKVQDAIGFRALAKDFGFPQIVMVRALRLELEGYLMRRTKKGGRCLKVMLQEIEKQAHFEFRRTLSRK
ncbi:hypothetical protein HDU97_008577 [Phlyctochytrium planicorne]|nr:hypothetical protein HDU97_008577 [Phlyctochytrium planicorne]